MTAPIAQIYTWAMVSMLRDRNRFVVVAAVLSSVIGILSLVDRSQWGWIIILVILPALPVRAVWRSMPSWLLLMWVAVPTAVGFVYAVSFNGYLMVVIAMVVACTGPTNTLDRLAIAGCFVASVFPPDQQQDQEGPWIWFGGLAIGAIFGSTLGQQWKLVDELKRTRARLAEAAVVDERRRIARELHDLVGHSFSVVLLHLSGARLLLAADPDEAAAALRRAESVGRQGMDELRQALSLMSDGTESIKPVGSTDVAQLVSSYQSAGMTISIDVTGDPDGVDAGPGVVVHEIIREALTNIVKHASEPAATIRLDIEPHGIGVRVENPVDPQPVNRRDTAGSPGLGLSGLRQRVTAVGGTFEARPVGGRWVVAALVPRQLAGVAT